MEIRVNPACSKCRAATQAFDEAGVSYRVRRYLDEPPTRAELENVLARLVLEPWHITHTNEAESIAVKNLSRTEGARGQWLQSLVDHPRLIQRPIITGRRHRRDRPGQSRETRPTSASSRTKQILLTLR